MAKTVHLQVRLTPEQKADLKDRAQRAGEDMSAYVLSRVLPPLSLRFEELLRRVAGDEERRFALAELNDFLAGLGAGELEEAVGEARLAGLSAYLQNYVAAMVEHVAIRRGVPPPAWVREVPPLDEPHFATDLAGLRLHLLRAAPVAFKRRNIFVDATVGDRV